MAGEFDPKKNIGSDGTQVKMTQTHFYAQYEGDTLDTAWRRYDKRMRSMGFEIAPEEESEKETGA